MTCYSPERMNSYTVKVVLAGDVGVGKTSFFMRFKDNKFNSTSTIGLEWCSKQLVIDGNRITFKLFDTSGMERYRTLTTGYYRSSQVVLLMYDVSKPITLANLTDWNKQILQYGPVDVVKILVGNKSDLQRSVSEVDVESFAATKDVCTKFTMEISAKTGENIEELFTKIGRLLLDDANARRAASEERINKNVVLSDNNKTFKDKLKCCRS